jgi:hypothetical protein
MQWIFRGKVISSAEEMHQIALNQPRWTANLEDSKRDNRHFYTNQGGGGSTQFERSFTTSLAFHFLQLAQYILPMLRDLLQKGSHGFTCGGATALIHLGLTFDCTADSERFGVKEKFQERLDFISDHLPVSFLSLLFSCVLCCFSYSFGCFKL